MVFLSPLVLSSYVTGQVRLFSDIFAPLRSIDRELLIVPPPPRGDFVHYDFLKLHYICCKMTHVGPLAVGVLLCYSHVNYVTL